MSNVIVIGGGAAGMMAAYTAASNGHNVRLIEKNEKLGKKIYITGKGRCNFTNACDFDTFINNIVSNPRFMYSSGRAFTSQDMVDFLENAGCRTKIERGNRAFPASDHASDVTKALERKMKEAGVRVDLNTEVKKITSLPAGGFTVLVSDTNRRESGKRAAAHGAELHAGAVIVCTGGLSYPSTGSTGDGYRFAKDAGLDVRACSPSLCPLTVEETDYEELQGVSLKNITLTVRECPDCKTADETALVNEGKKSNRNRKKNGLIMESEPGELLFTHFGLSGPLILSASALITGGLTEGRHYELIIDLKPGLTGEMLDERILRDFEGAQNQQVVNALGKLLISALRPVILKRAGIAPETKVRDITKEQRLKLVGAVKHLIFHVTGTRGYNEAVITQGGVRVSEIDPKTMEARNCPGLYFAGEVLDVDAYTGGFNLQIAWSTGHAAGTAV